MTKPLGTILFGRGMMAQLSSEMALLKVKNPIIITNDKNKKKAIKTGKLLIPGYTSGINIQANTPSNDYDFLIIMGDSELVKEYSQDIRPKALIPLSLTDIDSIKEPLSEYIVIDSKVVSCRKSTILENFFKAYITTVDADIDFPCNFIIPKAFTFSCRTSVLKADNSLHELGPLLNKLNVKSPLFLTDKGIESVGLLDLIKDELKKKDITVFKDIPPDSDTDTVNKISHIFNEENRDGIIALGGGSVLDTAKGVYLNVSLGTENLSKYSGSGIIPKLNTPFVCIPTTSGTGSEVTKVAVIADKISGRKNVFNSNHLQPDYAILDSRLTASLPLFLSSMTTMDALSHAVEAFTCLGKNPISDQLAWRSITLIRDHLIPMMKDPKNLEHRAALANASNLAGMAFSNSMVGMVHTIGHSIGSVCHVPHGTCMSILLPYGLEYNAKVITDELRQLKNALSTDSTEFSAIEIIKGMNIKLNDLTNGRHPLKFSEVKNRDGEHLVKPNQFEAIAKTALGDGSIVYNPRELRFDDIIKILEDAF
ncbi:MAG: iron-containing alcohol dehydrogenase [Spirochaetaceae bacterium]